MTIAMTIEQSIGADEAIDYKAEAMNLSTLSARLAKADDMELAAATSRLVERLLHRLD